MKYIRTKNGRTYSFIDIKIVGDTVIGYVNENDKNTLDGGVYLDKEQIIKQANTIKDLCDLFVYKNRIYEDAEFIKGPIIETIPHGQAKESDKIYLVRKKRDCGLFNGICVFDKEEWKKIYGAIWVLGEEGEPILQSICRFGDKEVFEFL